MQAQWALYPPVHSFLPASAPNHFQFYSPDVRTLTVTIENLSCIWRCNHGAWTPHTIRGTKEHLGHRTRGHTREIGYRAPGCRKKATGIAEQAAKTSWPMIT